MKRLSILFFQFQLFIVSSLCTVVYSQDINLATQNGLLKTSKCSILPKAKWEQINCPTNIMFLSLAAIGKDLIAGSYTHGIFRSLDDGRSWQPINTGLRENSTAVSFAVIDNVLFAEIYEGHIYRSNDHGSHWIKSDSGIGNTCFTGILMHQLIAFGTRLFYCRCYDRIYCSTDMGRSWSRAENGLPVNCYNFREGFSVVDSVLYAYSDKMCHNDSARIYRMLNNKSLWELVNPLSFRKTPFLDIQNRFGLLGESKGLNIPSKIYQTTKCALARNNLFLVGTENGMYISYDAGKHWGYSNKGIRTDVLDLSYVCGDLTLRTYRYCSDCKNQIGLYISRDIGTSWEFAGYPEMIAFASAKLEYYYTGTDLGIFKSTYVPISIQTNGSLLDVSPVYSLVAKNGTLIAGTREGAYKSIDSGNTWNNISGIPRNIAVKSLINTISTFAGTDSGVFILEKAAKQWRPFNAGMKFKKVDYLAYCSNTLIAVCRDSTEEYNEGGEYTIERNIFYHFSSEAGKWVMGKSFLFDSLQVTTFATAGEYLFVGTGNGFYYSSNLGYTWIPLNAGLPKEDLNIQALVTNNDLLFMGTSSGLYRLTLVH